MAEPPPHILEPGGTEVQTRAGGARRHRKELLKFRWKDFQFLFGESFTLWSKHNAPRLGAALSFYTLLSLAPLLLILSSAAALAFGPKAAGEGLIRQVYALGGREAARAVEALLASPHSPANGVVATILGLIMLLFGASGVIIELRDDLNFIWDVPARELKGMKMITGAVRDRLFSFALVLGVGFLLVVSLAVNVWIAALGAYSSWILPANEALLHTLSSLVSFLVISGLFAAIYKVVPDVSIEWRDVALGGGVTSLLFSLGKLGLGIYLGKATFASAYGAAASIVVLIVWIYYSAQIFFLGAEFTRVFADRYGCPMRHALVVTPDQQGSGGEAVSKSDALPGVRIERS
jgi:membrane protein